METTQALDYKALYEQERAEKEALQFAVATLRHELDQLKKMIFGSKHERFLGAANSSQLTLDLAMEVMAASATTETVIKEVTVTQPLPKKPFVHPGRSALPAHLRREEIILEPEFIPEGSRKIGEEITEKLDLIEAELLVKRYIRPKYATPQAEGAVNTEIIIADAPACPIEKGIADSGLLAHIIIEKYVDHLPLYRQMQRFARNGVTISDSTIGGWISAVCALLMPLYAALKLLLIKSGYIHADETTIKVLDKTKKGTTHHGYFWVYNNSPGKIVYFEYQKGRDAEAITELLSTYQGYLQTDGYAVYEEFDKKAGITQLCCMAHARRKFIEAQGNDAVRSAYVLEQMQQLYAIERHCKEKNRDNEQKAKERTERANPILEHLGKWMKEQYLQVLPKSPIGMALAYSITRWEKLSIYTTNGMLCIDNNPVENSIRPVALGRKNYLFCGSHEAAKRTAMIYSLVGTCKLNGVNPHIWLKDVLERIPTHPVNQINELLPHLWKKKEKS